MSAVRFSDVHKRFGGVTAVSGLSLAVGDVEREASDGGHAAEALVHVAESDC